MRDWGDFDEHGNVIPPHRGHNSERVVPQMRDDNGVATPNVAVSTMSIQDRLLRGRGL